MYSAILHCVGGSGRVNMSSATEATCVPFTVALRLTKKKNRRWAKEWYKRKAQKHNMHTNIL
jgi:hypothetical protein